MNEPAETLIVHWHEAPPAEYERVNDYEYRCAYRYTTCVLWRGRWVVVDDSLIGQLGEFDRRLRAGTLGLIWQREAS